jgi:hypothetical protein
MDDAHYTICKRVGSTMTMSTKVQKSFLVIKILLIHHWVLVGEKVGNLFHNVYLIIQNNSSNIILKNMMSYGALIPKTLKQMDI